MISFSPELAWSTPKSKTAKLTLESYTTRLDQGYVLDVLCGNNELQRDGGRAGLADELVEELRERGEDLIALNVREGPVLVSILRDSVGIQEGAAENDGEDVEKVALPSSVWSDKNVDVIGSS
jgi:hypothetical protein